MDEPLRPTTEEALAGPDRARLPILSVLSGLVCVALFLAAQPLGDMDAGELARLGAPDAGRVWSGAWWGLVTSSFVHLQPIHLLANLSWVWSLGGIVERRLGHVAWLVLFVLASVVASAAQLAIGGDMGIGMSGVVYAWAGFAWTGGAREPALRAAIEKQAGFLLLWLVVCFGLTRAGTWNVANAAHAGGLAFGLVAGHAWAGGPGRALAGGASVGLVAVAIVSAVWAPWSADWWYWRGSAALERDDGPAARAAMEAALERDPDHILARFIRGQFRAQDGDLVGAEADLSAYLQKIPSFSFARLQRARVRRELGRPRGTFEDAQPALVSAEDDEQRLEAHDLRAWALAQLDRPAEALPDLDALVKARPDDLSAGWQRAAARRAADDEAGAVAELRRALELPLARSTPRLRFALLEAVSDRAGRDAEVAAILSATPEDPVALRARAWGLVARDPRAALEDYRRATRAAPASEERQLMEALLEVTLGDRASGLAALRQLAAHVDVYPALWLAVLADERAGLAQVVESERPWPPALARNLRGELGEEELLRLAREAPTRRLREERLCEAYGYLGAAAERAGDAARARVHYEACVATGVENFVEFQWACVRLATAGR